MPRICKELQGLSWWTSGKDFMLPIQGARVRPLIRDPDLIKQTA